jgi:hypothetical protein
VTNFERSIGYPDEPDNKEEQNPEPDISNNQSDLFSLNHKIRVTVDID